jgi:cell division protein FtsW
MRQSLFAAAGVAVMYFVSKINYQTFRWLAVPLLIFSIMLLVMVLIPGVGVRINGARRWLRMAIVAGPTYQPSEIVKVAVILFFASRLSKRSTQKKKKWSKRTATGRALNFLEKIGFLELLPYGLILLLIAGLMLKEPHMSGTILVLAGGAAVLFAAGISIWWFVAGISLVGGALGLIITATPYMTARINLWLDPWSDPLGKGFQTIQSLLAIGSGGLLGLGFGKSRQKFLYVPEPENDFVFPIVVEELGFIGGTIVILLFMLLILRGYWLALHARDKFGTLTIVGITTLLAVQVFLNIGVVTNLIPNTGISLPFFSYGGTALMIQLAEIGIILSVSRQIPAPKND